MISKRTFTLIELLVVIAILGILASLLLPSLMRAKYYARNTLCISNIRQMLIGLTLYADDYDGFYPHRGVAARSLDNSLTAIMVSPNPRYAPPSWDYRAFFHDYFSPDLNSLMKCPMGPTNYLGIRTDADTVGMHYSARGRNLNYFGDPPNREGQSASYATCFDATPGTAQTASTRIHWDRKMAKVGQPWQTRAGLPGRTVVSEYMWYKRGNSQYQVTFSKRGLAGYDPSASNTSNSAFNLFNASYPVDIWALFNAGQDDGSVLSMPVMFKDISGTTGNLLSATGNLNGGLMLPAESYE